MWIYFIFLQGLHHKERNKIIFYLIMVFYVSFNYETHIIHLPISLFRNDLKQKEKRNQVYIKMYYISLSL